MNKMKIIASILFSVLALFGSSQELSTKELKKFAAAEELLKVQVDQFRNDSLSFETRVQAIHEFIPRFVAILKEKDSYYYPFDSLLSVVKVYAQDNSFRIFTWQLKEP